MGPLTAEMSRLCQEIVTLRRQRQAYVRDLAQNVSFMKAEFRQAHTEMAQKERKFRAASLAELKAAVAGMRRAFALDFKGAHRAWFGPSPAERRTEAEAARRAREEAERLRQQAELRAREAAAEAQRQAETQDRKEDAQMRATAKEKEAGRRSGAKGRTGSERQGAGKKGA